MVEALVSALVTEVGDLEVIAVAHPEGDPVLGKPAPDDWAIETWYQGEDGITLDGRGTTLIIFWEAWCPHCRNEVPKLQQVYDRYREQGLQVVGVTRITKTATEESVREFIADSGVGYAMAKETGDLAGYFNVKGIPAAACCLMKSLARSVKSRSIKGR